VSVFRALNAKLSSWIDGAILMLPNLVVAVLIVVGFWVAARFIRAVTLRLLARLSHATEVNRLLAGAAYVGTVAAGTFIALGVLKLDKTVTSLLAGAGILGLAVGFAFQDIAANFIAGVLISLRHPFRVGDLIETNGFYGTVRHLNLRATEMMRLDGQLVFIPNKDVFQKPIVNYTVNGVRRVDLPVGISYGEDLEQVRRVTIEAVSGVPGRDPARDVELFFNEFGDSSINFVVRFWIPFVKEPDYLQAMSEAIMRLKRAYDDAGITIPFPIRTLDFSEVGGRRLAAELSGTAAAAQTPER
jgi:small conductance mechanosensitive channel